MQPRTPPCSLRLAAVCGRGSAGAGVGGVGTHQAASHPVFVQGGLWNLSSLRGRRLPPCWAPRLGAGPIGIRGGLESSPTGSWEGWGQHLRAGPEETLKRNTDVSLWGSRTAGLPAPFGYSNPCGFQFSVFPFSPVDRKSRLSWVQTPAQPISCALS